jgi:tetratricopeptide (TPR) repeat protein
MKPSLKSLITKVRKLHDSNQQAEALSLADELIAAHPEEPTVWAARAHLHVLTNEYANANSDLSIAAELNPGDPYFLFRRGLNHMELANWKAAVSDFTDGLRLRDPAYELEFRFARAEALVALGEKKKAVQDLNGVPNEFAIWTGRMRSQTELLSECGH